MAIYVSASSHLFPFYATLNITLSSSVPSDTQKGTRTGAFFVLSIQQLHSL